VSWTYGALWRRLPGSILYLLAVFALAMVALSTLASVFWTGVGLLVVVVGLPIIVVALFVARAFGVADRYLLRLTGLPQITEPEWNRDRSATSTTWADLTRPLRNGHYWLYLVHGMVVSPIISTITFTITVLWVSLALGGLSFWLWGAFLPRDDSRPAGEWIIDRAPLLFGEWSSYAVESIVFLLIGILAAVTLPWVAGGLTRGHHAIASAMLGRWRSDDLVAEVRAEAAARGAAVQAEDAALRRLERDIHDGPQQRLVRLQMDLAALERRVESGETDAAADLAREARDHAKAALDELRALSSGVAPPLLQDRGLAAALAAIAASTPLGVHVDVDPAVDSVVPGDVARTVYFIVAELLTNAVKHAQASAATLKVALRPATPATVGTLDVWVVDNGRGGAQLSIGHGLAGLRDRVAGLRGTLIIDSPYGGPTSVGAHIPLVTQVSA
jgi:signal transduction histidine kinase